VIIVFLFFLLVGVCLGVEGFAKVFGVFFFDDWPACVCWCVV